MFNDALARDYILRSEKRLKALAVLVQEEAWADVVREAQEIVELSLKALLRVSGVEVPRVHDVSSAIEECRSRLPTWITDRHIEEFLVISRSLRRDRELAFYGSEDLTPSEFYKKSDAKKAFDWAEFVVKSLKPILKS